MTCFLLAKWQLAPPVLERNRRACGVEEITCKSYSTGFFVLLIAPCFHSEKKKSGIEQGEIATIAFT